MLYIYIYIYMCVCVHTHLMILGISNNKIQYFRITSFRVIHIVIYFLSVFFEIDALNFSRASCF